MKTKWIPTEGLSPDGTDINILAHSDELSSIDSIGDFIKAVSEDKDVGIQFIYETSSGDAHIAQVDPVTLNILDKLVEDTIEIEEIFARHGIDIDGAPEKSVPISKEVIEQIGEYSSLSDNWGDDIIPPFISDES